MKGLIEIENMEFFARHGCYEEERVVGNKFLVNVHIHTNCSKAAESDNINDALNYQTVYNLVKAEMAIASNLLEHVAKRILTSIRNNFSEIEHIRVKVSKLNPPMGGKMEKVSVELSE